ncbi:MAG: Fur family transcriptional regulator [Bacillota bacterium]
MTYNTKQSREILACLKSFGHRHVTVTTIRDALAKNGSSVGIATIYRQLEKMEKDGVVRKFILDGKAGACFQYAGEESGRCEEHYHLKCERCGKLIHLQCHLLDSVEDHILADHGFKVNSMKTVLYGICAECAEKEGEEPSC